jgi:hypothetical protein
LTITVAYHGWYLGLPLVGVVAGIAGRRYRWIRYILVGLAPLYAASLFVLLFIGSVLAGTDSLGVVVIVLATIFSMAPIVSAWSRTRAPSVVATIALVAMTVLFIYGLLLWLPATTAVLGAAIAGPPRPAVKPGP